MLILLCATCIISVMYIYNNYKEYKLKWSRIIIIGNMYTICIKICIIFTRTMYTSKEHV